MTEKMIALQFMPLAQKWRVLIDGKAFPRRFSDRAEAVREYERQKNKELLK